MSHVTLLTKIEGNWLSSRYNIVDTVIWDRPDQLVFHKTIAYLIVEADYSRIMRELPVQYEAIASTVQILSFLMTCTVLVQLPRLY